MFSFSSAEAAALLSSAAPDCPRLYPDELPDGAGFPAAVLSVKDPVKTECTYTDGTRRCAVSLSVTVYGPCRDAADRARLSNFLFAYRDAVQKALPLQYEGVSADGFSMTEPPRKKSAFGSAYSVSAVFSLSYLDRSSGSPACLWFMQTPSGIRPLHGFRVMRRDVLPLTQETQYFDDPDTVTVLTGRRQRIYFRFDRDLEDPAQNALLTASDSCTVGEHAAVTLYLATGTGGQTPYACSARMYSASVTEMRLSDGRILFGGVFLARGDVRTGTAQVSGDGEFLTFHETE